MSIIPIQITRYSTAYDPYSLKPYVFIPWDAFNCKTLYEHCRNYPRDGKAVPNLQIDWKETPDAHVFKADLPGLKKEYLKIVLQDDRILEIEGEHRLDEAREGERYRCIEQRRGMFLRRFRLPENANAEEAKAEMENGVLTVTVPKNQKPRSQPKDLEIYG